MPVLQAIVRDELARTETIGLGVVTSTATDEAGDGAHRIDVNVRLRGSALELQRVPVAVGRRGVSAAPLVGDLVVLGFVGGSVDGAVVLGSIYDEQIQPPKAGPTELVYEVPDDADDAARRVELKLPNGNTVTVNDAKIVIKLGSTSVTIDADGGLTVESSSGDITLKGSNVAIEAQSKLSLKGATASLEGSGQASVKASMISIAGTTSFSAG
jgi:phage baseplate assembly protein gpV